MSNLLCNNHFDYIVLLAAVASVADSVNRPFETHETNQEANLNIIETLRINKIKFKKLFFASSAAVYGSLPELPKKESSPVEPQTQYAIDKYATERAVINYSKLYGMPMVCARFFNVFGPNQNPDSPYSGVLSIIIEKLIHNDIFTLFGDGKQTRDFVYVDDVVSAIIGLLTNNKLVGEVYNVANGNKHGLRDIISELETISNKTLKIKIEEQRSGDIHDSYADISKISHYSIMTHTPIDIGLEKYFSSVDGNKNM